MKKIVIFLFSVVAGSVINCSDVLINSIGNGTTQAYDSLKEDDSSAKKLKIHNQDEEELIAREATMLAIKYAVLLRNPEFQRYERKILRKAEGLDIVVANALAKQKKDEVLTAREQELLKDSNLFCRQTENK